MFTDQKATGQCVLEHFLVCDNVHPCSLISVFVTRSMESLVAKPAERIMLVSLCN